MTRMTLEERIHCVRLYSLYDGSPSEIQFAWKKKFSTEPPSRKSILLLNRKFDKTGTVADLVRKGRPKTSTTQDKITLVENAILVDPTKSLRSVSNDLGISKTSVQRIKKESEKNLNVVQMENKKLKERIQLLTKEIQALQSRVSSRIVPSTSTAINPKPVPVVPVSTNTLASSSKNSSLRESEVQKNATAAEEFDVQYIDQSELASLSKQSFIINLLTDPATSVGDENSQIMVQQLPDDTFRLLQVPVAPDTTKQIKSPNRQINPAQSYSFNPPCNHEIVQPTCPSCLTSILQFQT